MKKQRKNITKILEEFGWANYDVGTVRINGMSNEYGYTSLNELENIDVQGFQVERDLHFERQKLENINNPQLHDFLIQMTA
jgi:hypothetical protein